jgi:hypothetical protein
VDDEADIAKVGVDLQVSLHFVGPHNVVDFVTDLRGPELPEGHDGFGCGSEGGAGETCGSQVGLSLVLVYLVLYAPLDETFDVLT